MNQDDTNKIDDGDVHPFATMMGSSQHRKRLYRNASYLAAVLFGYAVSVLLVSRRSIPIQEITAFSQYNYVENKSKNVPSWMAENEQEGKKESQRIIDHYSEETGALSTEKSLQSPGITWLMSFGGSGTSYTITNVEVSTGTTTATNYAEDFDDCIGVLPAEDGRPSPCLHKPYKLDLPKSPILTKTHCGGYCMDCTPNAYVHTTDSFELACRTAKLKRNGSIEEFTYNLSLVDRVIHLIRNPFDNLVGRMHLSKKRRQKQGKSTDLWEDTPEGISAWCKGIDEHIIKRERKSPLVSDEFLDKYAHVPCHAEWFRFAQWHTRTLEVVKRLQVPVHVLYYENYTTNFDETTAELLDFLHLDAPNPPYPFRPGKSYAHMFDRAQVRSVAELVQYVSSPEAWNLLKHYFDLQDQVSKGQNGSVSGSTNKTFPTIALLMSFPNSGTSYTISNTEHVSQRTTASNYGADLYLHPNLPRGPYIHREKMELPSKFMLTKTHCMGFCDYCHPNKFVIHSGAEFLQNCLTGERTVNGTRVSDTYDASLVTRAIHLFRSPFDNLVARMHLGVERRRDVFNWTEEELALFSHSREGRLAWCRYVDNRFRDNFLKRNYVSEDVKTLMDDLPCFLDWYRWVQWHNYAIEVTEMQRLPTHYLYYEQYTTYYNHTLSNLLDFLYLPNTRPPLKFHSGKTYRDLYSDDEAILAGQVVRALASPSCWKLIQHYFDEPQDA